MRDHSNDDMDQWFIEFVYKEPTIGWNEYFPSISKSDPGTVDNTGRTTDGHINPGDEWSKRFSLRSGRIWMPDNIMFILNVLIGVVTCGSLIIACLQLGQANTQIRQSDKSYVESMQQFAASGPKYSWFMASSNQLEFFHTTGEDGTVYAQVAYGAVISNNGRTGDTIVAVSDNVQGNGMKACSVDMTPNGKITGSGVELDGVVRLEPGESRFVVLSSPWKESETKERGSVNFSIPKSLTIRGLSAIGRTGDQEPLFLLSGLRKGNSRLRITDQNLA